MADLDRDIEREAPRLPRPGGTFAPFRYPAFRAIWIANLASNLGSTIQSVAAAWLMTDLTTSHRLIALVQASATIPIMLFGIVAGAIADNYDRRHVMLTAQIGMLVTSATLAVMTWQGLITPHLLLAFTLTVGIGTALNSPAWQASVRQQVGLADLPQAISLNTISFNLARSVGPALGGLLLSLWNVSLAFAINAASFIAMIVVLWRWRPEFPPVVRKPMLPAIALGLGFCASSSPLRRILIRGFAFGFGVAGYQALVPAAVRDRLRGGEIDFGLMLGLFGIGSIVAALFIARARRRFGVEMVLAAATLSFVIAQSVLAEASSVYQALPAALLAGGGWVMALTSLNVSMQMRSPENIIGRCLSIYQAVTFGGMALGSWAWGVVADWRGLPTALHGASAFLLTAIVVLRVLAPMPKPHEGRLEHAPQVPSPR
ncbi:MAG: MFS transporter [Novosphingobium sp.]|jgi:MFS family permease|nr:MFS transporter [Novosphingobium sp.]